MHISLDSALGRQKRLNSVGESVLQIAPDAAAAYSLRSLTGGDPDVVRVRRESDNTEKDFSGSQIESGEMARWVNEQPTLPLDLRELDTNTGERDGALIEAAAAYSLRKLKEDFTGDVVEVRRNVDGETEGFTADEVTDGTLEGFVNASFDDELPLDQATGASAAYSLRNLSSSYTGDVVEVRRSSDDTVQSFTAAEVADGTLTDWVSEDVTIYQSDFSSGVDGWSQGGVTTLSGNQDGVSDGATSKDNVLKLTKNQDSQAYTSRDQGVIAGLTYTVSGSFYAPSSNTAVDGILIKDGIAGGSLSNYPSGYLTSSGVWTDFSFSYTATVSGAQRINMGISPLGSSPNGSSAGSTGDVVYISDLQFVETTSNGHVKTWYDQSGSDNHATQTDTANQPKIVDGGTYLGEIDFDGSSDELASSSSVDVAQLATAFSVIKPLNNSANKYVWTIGGTNGIISYINASELASLAAGAPLSGPALSATANSIKFDFCNTTSSQVAVNGSSGVSGSIGTRSGNDVIRIGGRDGADFMYGSISEIIIYNSDQSDKRRAIEENIANHYDISLAAFSRDGTVKTWYDQSGSTPSNDAVQTDATKQPKIVENGSVLEDSAGNPEIDFDGTSHRFDIDFGSNLPQPNSIFMVHQSDSVLEADNEFFDEKDTTGQRTLLDVTTVGAERRYRILASTSLSSTNLQVTTDKNLVSAIYNGSNSSLSLNGDAFNFTNTVGGDSIARLSSIGFSEGTGGYYDGTMQEFIIYNSDQSDNRTAIEANIGETYGITGIPAANDTVNGYVQTWYDQSGSGNGAVQISASSQPKIVDSGALVTRNINGTASPSIKFGASNKMIHGITSLSADGQQSLFFVADNQMTSGDSSRLLEIMSSTADEERRRRPLIFKDQNQAIVFSVDSLGGIYVTAANSDQVSVYSSITDDTSGGTHTVYQDGTQVGSATVTLDANPTLSTNHEDQLGHLLSNAVGNFYFTEIVYYNSDQSPNRPAIEANIANQYGIPLS